MKIFVAGASGFVGEPVVRDLLSAGHEVIALAHSLQSVEALKSIHPGLAAVAGDVANRDAMLRAVPYGTEAIVYLPGLLREFPKKGLTFRAVHVEGVRNLLAAAKQATAIRWVQMSALGADSNPTIEYYRTKFEAEELVKASGLGWTILRPSLIFDDRPRRQHSFVSEVTKAIRSAPFIPILGNGNFLLQPVSVEDVSKTIIESLTKPETMGKIYEMGGPEKLTYREIVLTIARAMGSKKPAVSIPLSAILFAARLFGRFPWFPITADQILMLKNGNFVHDSNEDRIWRETFNLPLKRFSDKNK
jgi:NADH dehydrogenase